MQKQKTIQKIANLEVKEKLTIDGAKLFLDNGLSSLLIRKSGTEPLLRFYIESELSEKLEKIKNFIKENIN